MNDFKPPILSWQYIRDLTKRLRRELLKNPNIIPIPIEKIVEFKLGITIDPEPFLKEEFGIDGQLLSDLSTIMIDSKMYYDEKFLPRVRFTLAHELGHYYLHRDQIMKARFSSVSEWIKFIQSVPDEDLSWFERQADEFAGSFLVPTDVLVKLLIANNDRIKKYLEISTSDEAQDRAINAISLILCSDFIVSHNVIETRIRREKLWEKLGFDSK